MPETQHPPSRNSHCNGIHRETHKDVRQFLEVVKRNILVVILMNKVRYSKLKELCQGTNNIHFNLG